MHFMSFGLFFDFNLDFLYEDTMDSFDSDLL
jgi:hypothetical protein